MQAEAATPFSEKANNKIFRGIPRIAGNKIIIWHPYIDCLLPLPKKGKLTEWAGKWKVGVTYCCTHGIE